jgi:(2Fe-2S) ferredoxin
MKYDVHVFVCANQKTENRKCCTEGFGNEAVAKLRHIVKEAKLPLRIRVQKAGCLDVCQQGPALVIYPEGTFYGNLNMEMLDQIVHEHIIKGQKLDSFILEDE